MKKKPSLPYTESLRDMRNWAGLTQEEAAKATGLHPITISKIECGHMVPSFQTVGKLLYAYGVSRETAARILLELAGLDGR
jgi:DNA-binding XRE family transcriptional regulator